MFDAAAMARASRYPVFTLEKIDYLGKDVRKHLISHKKFRSEFMLIFYQLHM